MVFASCSRDDEGGESVDLGGASLSGSGIYFKFSDKYNYLSSGGKLIEEIGLDRDYFKYDISFDNKKIVAAWEREPYSSYGTNYQTFVTASLPSLKKGAITKSYLESNKSTEIHHFHGQIASSGGTDFHISPDGKYAAINGTHPITDPDHPLTIIDLATGQEVAAFKHPSIDGDEHWVIGWTQNNEVFFSAGETVVKTSAALNWNPQGVVSLPNKVYPRVNRQGTQLVFRYNLHIYLYDISSGTTRQVTTSNATSTSTSVPSGEYAPAFSPDGRFIAFEGRPSFSWNPNWNNLGGAFGSATVLIIVPNDGKLYDLEAQNGGGAIFPKHNGNPVLSTGRKIIWR